MDLRQLAVVVAIVDEGGFGRAAEALGLSQPSVSQSVHTLERELGLPLFVRAGRRVSLTPAGEALLAPARRALADVETARAAVGAVVGLAGGRLVVACLPTLAVDPVSELVARFRRRHDRVVVHLVEPDEGATVEDLVADGRAEVGFCELPAGTGLEARWIADQELVAVLSRGHAAAMLIDGELPVERLAELPLVVPPAGTSIRRRAEEALAAGGGQPTIAVETDSRESIVPLVEGGAGAGLLPRPVAERARHHRVVVAALRPPVTRAIGAVHRVGGLSPAAEALLRGVGR